MLLRTQRPAKRSNGIRTILAINGGSSSLRFAVYEHGPALTCLVRGRIDRAQEAEPVLILDDLRDGSHEERAITATDHASMPPLLISTLITLDLMGTVDAIGHRVVHGMGRSSAEVISTAFLCRLRESAVIDPDHQPAELDMIDALHRHDQRLRQIACFDTAFHSTMPRVATILPLPRRFENSGMKRYGFHGLSYTYLSSELERLAGRDVAHGKVILAHLGNGSSMVALKNGRSVDTSMGFTPASGLPMGTRAGDLDPGCIAYLQRTEGMTIEAFNDMANHASGLLGVSETSADMRTLLAREAIDHRAAEAVKLYCYQARKCIGAYAAVLDGLETLVFAGGIGENSAVVRARICEGLGFLGVEMDTSRNALHAGIVSTDRSRVCIRVIRTDEEVTIARSVLQVLASSHVLGEVPQ